MCPGIIAKVGLGKKKYIPTTTLKKSEIIAKLLTNINSIQRYKDITVTIHIKIVLKRIWLF